MALVALTRIEYGSKDGQVKVFNEGDTVSAKDFDEEAWGQLEDAGAVGLPQVKAAEVADENEALKAQVAALKAQLAEVQKPATK